MIAGMQTTVIPIGLSRRNILPTVKLGFAVLMVMAITIPAAQARPLLDELHTLLATHPSLKASLSEANARREEVAVAQSSGMPFVQSTGESGLERTDQPANQQLRNQIGLRVTQNLFDGYGTENRVRASQLNEQVGHSDFQSVQGALLLDGIQSYLDVVLQNKLVEISARHVEIVEEITQFIATERDAGRMTLADSLQSRARLQQAREMMISFDGGRLQSAARYQTLFGRTPDVGAMDDPQAPTAMIPLSLDEGLNYALDHNPTLDAARLSIDMASAQRLASGATNLPRIDLEGAVDLKNDYDGSTGSEEEGTLLVKLTWDIFDGNRTSSTELAAAHRESGARATLHERELEITEQVRMAWNSLMTDRQRMQTLGEAESIALEAYNARYSLMATGKETIINVLDTALEVLSVRTSLTTSDYRYRLSVYRLLHAMGRLSPTTINAVISIKPIDLGTISKIAPNQLDPADMAPSPITGDASAFAMTSMQPVPTQPPVSVGLPLPRPAPEITSIMANGSTGENPIMKMEPGTGYLVVLSSNRNPNNATATHQKLAFPGSEIEAVDVKGKPMYMIVIGPLPEPEARLVQGEAFDAGLLDAWLKKI